MPSNYTDTPSEIAYLKAHIEVMNIHPSGSGKGLAGGPRAPTCMTALKKQVFPRLLMPLTGMRLLLAAFPRRDSAASEGSSRSLMTLDRAPALRDATQTHKGLGPQAAAGFRFTRAQTVQDVRSRDSSLAVTRDTDRHCKWRNVGFGAPCLPLPRVDGPQSGARA